MGAQLIGDQVVTTREMRSYLSSGGFFTLTWPANATVKDLKGMRELCNFQIDAAIKWTENTEEVMAEKWAKKLWADWSKP